MTGDWAEWAAVEARSLRAAGRWRSVRDLDGVGPATSVSGGPPVVSFGSNDYLGLARHPAVVAAACEAVERWGAGAASAPFHAANLGVLQALG
ncbi:MAG TPA: hypothetical protein VM263_11785, partial [Acidimicrobiales bacterium]|nr:hypothetical protein [Acidimicrobiales bacterium]